MQEKKIDEVVELNTNAVEEEPKELTAEEIKTIKTQALLTEIRDMSKARRPVTASALTEKFEADPGEAEALLAEAMKLEDNRDICVYMGKKNKYYYVYPMLAHNYVRAIALSEEKDDANTVVTLVRYDSKTYPRPTRCSDLAKEPYCLDAETVKAVVAKLQADPEYSDIQTFTSSHGTFYIYSEQSLSEVYAKKLAEDSEDMTLWF